MIVPGGLAVGGLDPAFAGVAVEALGSWTRPLHTPVRLRLHDTGTAVTVLLTLATLGHDLQWLAYTEGSLDLGLASQYVAHGLLKGPARPCITNGGQWGQAWAPMATRGAIMPFKA